MRGDLGKLGEWFKVESVPPIVIIVLFVVGVAVLRGLIRKGVGAGMDAARKEIDKRAGKYEPSQEENLSDRLK